MADDQSVKARIEKDIGKFYQNMGRLEGIGNDNAKLKVVELSKMYASDAKTYMEKGDLYTAFSCISYAHGLLDAVLKLSGSDSADVL